MSKKQQIQALLLHYPQSVLASGSVVVQMSTCPGLLLLVLATDDPTDGR